MKILDEVLIGIGGNVQQIQQVTVLDERQWDAITASEGPKPEFPWKWIGIGAGAALLIFAAAKKRKE